MGQPVIDSAEISRRAERRLGEELSEKWTLQSVLGIGGMATVYAARHRNHSRVAIKMLHSHFSSDPIIVERFLKEGYAGNSVDHRGVVRVLDDGTAHDGAAFVVMDLLEGLSLEQLLQRHGPLAAPHVVDFGIQALDILAAAHERGVIHRDIKPDNFFVTLDGEVKLLDFGIARLSEGGNSTTVGTFMGTPAYASPEQARGKWELVDGRSDLWSLAATLFSALTCQQVHQGETAMELLALAVHSTPRRLEETGVEVPADLATAVHQALSTSRDERFASARVFLHALIQIEEQLEESEDELADLVAGALTASGDTATLIAKSGDSSHPSTPSGSRISDRPSYSRRRRSRGSRTSLSHIEARSGQTELGGTPQLTSTANGGSTDTVLASSRTTPPRSSRKSLAFGLLAASLVGSTVIYLSLAGDGATPDQAEAEERELEQEPHIEAQAAATAAPGDAPAARADDKQAPNDTAADDTAPNDTAADAPSTDKPSADKPPGSANADAKQDAPSSAPAVAATASKPTAAPQPRPQATPTAAPAAPAPAASPAPASSPTLSREQLLKGRY